MTQIITPKAQRLELAHILCQHIGDYQNQYRLWSEHKKIVTDLLNCRKVQLGGQMHPIGQVQKQLCLFANCDAGV